MRLFIVRHAIAHERNRKRWPNDALRPLTPAGQRKFRKAAAGLAPWLPKSAALLTSPWIRARDTAAMLAKAAKHAKATECAELTGSASVEGVFALLRKRREKAVVIVGHEPQLSGFMAAALGGPRQRFKIEFRKGGAACIEFGARVEAGRATLVWMMPPKVLRALA